MRINTKEVSYIKNYVIKKVNRNLKLENFPHITVDGKWITTEDCNWTSGFWIGLLWFSYEITGNDMYKREAYKWLERLEERRNDKTFDLSFLFCPSFVLGYKLTGDEYLREVGLKAANTLSTLFHDKAGFVYDKIDERTGRTIIDVMMNLPLLWWAYEETNDHKYLNVAYTHAKKTLKEFIREDFSTIHVIDFDLENGKIMKKITVQGYNDNSCWSRGQAWAIYGFTLAYKYTKDKLFLKTTRNLAEYFIKNLPEDYVPYWDFDDPEKSVKDSSAAAIASSGLLTLSELSGQEEFRETALRILDSLWDYYLAEENRDGILKHGCYHKPEGIGVDESLIWGDYYFVESLMKIGRYNEKS